MRKVLVVLLAGATLCACNRGGGGFPFGGAVTPPARKPGLWEQTIKSDQFAMQLTTRLCLDAASDQRAPVLGRRFRRGACDKYSITRGADGSYISDTVCQTGEGAKITSHTVASGDFSTRYTVKSQRTIEGSPDPDRDGQFGATITAIYKGPCPAGMLPGQIQRPDGTIIDIPVAGGFGRPGGMMMGGGNTAGNSAAGGNAAAPSQ
ncbi:MAG: DUF3617 domain-containing protein [Caulobacterales bacterium]